MPFSQVKFILEVICSSCQYGRIGQEVTGDTPELCAAYVAAADEIRSTARSLAAAIKAKDLRSVNRLVPKLKEMMHALVPALVRAYPKEALEKTWSKIQDALYRQRDVDTPAFLRELQTCPKPVDVAFALRPTLAIGKDDKGGIGRVRGAAIQEIGQHTICAALKARVVRHVSSRAAALERCRRDDGA